MDVLLAKLLNNQIPSESEIDHLCCKVTDILIKEENIMYVSSPVIVVGDIHGQYFDLKNIFNLFGSPDEKKYIFLGDLVDRGVHSVEVICLLLVYKTMYPDNIYLVRGNHESKKISSVYGFFDEVHAKYGTSSVYRSITDVFNYFLLGVVVDGRHFCVHGGISSVSISLDEFSQMQRFFLIPEKQPISDLLWSDPGSHSGFEQNMRGLGCTYGHDVVQLFLLVNKLEKVIRSHQLVMEGYRYDFKDKSCITVWSAPNYCYRCNNIASVMSIDGIFHNFKTFKHVKEQAPGHRFTNPFFSYD